MAIYDINKIQKSNIQKKRQRINFIASVARGGIEPPTS